MDGHSILVVMNARLFMQLDSFKDSLAVYAIYLPLPSIRTFVFWIFK